MKRKKIKKKQERTILIGRYIERKLIIIERRLNEFLD